LRARDPHNSMRIIGPRPVHRILYCDRQRDKAQILVQDIPMRFYRSWRQLTLNRPHIILMFVNHVILEGHRGYLNSYMILMRKYNNIFFMFSRKNKYIRKWKT
jgi:hypothetical protein